MFRWLVCLVCLLLMDRALSLFCYFSKVDPTEPGKLVTVLADCLQTMKASGDQVFEGTELSCYITTVETSSKRASKIQKYLFHGVKGELHGCHRKASCPRIEGMLLHDKLSSGDAVSRVYCRECREEMCNAPLKNETSTKSQHTPEHRGGTHRSQRVASGGGGGAPGWVVLVAFVAAVPLL